MVKAAAGMLKITKEIKARKPVLIASWPGIGNMSTVAVSYLKDKLKAEEFAEVEPFAYFDPTGILVNNNIVEEPKFPQSKFYHWAGKGAQNDIIFFIGEAQPGVKVYEFAEKILDIAKKFKVKRVYTCAAAVVRMPYAQNPKVWAVATKESLVEELKKYDVELKGDFLISGLNGLLLGVAKERGIEGICLLGEVPFYAGRVDNPRASLAVLEVLRQMLSVKIDLAALEAQAKEADARIEKLAKEAMSEFIEQYTKPVWEQEQEEEE